MKTSVSGTKATGFYVSVVEGWGKVDSGFPTFWGTKVAEGFATAAEAFAWAEEYEAGQV